MIPKKIHYCWFGRGKMPAEARRCIDSWRKYLPEYEIKEWNEDNFDLDAYPYAREAYDARKFAFVTDIVRLHAMLTEGGIYMDTDVEVLKPLDALLGYEGVSGFESSTQIPTGLMACRAGHPLVAEWLEWYDGRHFLRPDGTPDLTTNVATITNICLRHGFRPDGTLQTVAGFTFLPSDYLCPKDHRTGKIHLTPNTLAIHHFSGSWHSPKDKCLVWLRTHGFNWVVKLLVEAKHFLLKNGR